MSFILINDACLQQCIKYLGCAILKRVKHRKATIIMQGTVYPESDTSDWLVLTNSDRCVDKLLTLKTIEKPAQCWESQSNDDL